MCVCVCARAHMRSARLFLSNKKIIMCMIAPAFSGIAVQLSVLFGFLFLFSHVLLLGHLRHCQETTKDPAVEGSRSYQSSATPRFQGTKAPKTLVLLCFGAIREPQEGADGPWPLSADFLNPKNQKRGRQTGVRQSSPLSTIGTPIREFNIDCLDAFKTND